MKKILTTIAAPPVWFRWLFGLASLIGVFAVLKYGQSDTVYAYVLYPASALGLVYLISVTIVPLAQKIWDRKTAGLDEHAADRARWISYRRTGWLMFLLILGLSGITVMTVRFNQGDIYPGKEHWGKDHWRRTLRYRLTGHRMRRSC